jgi:hypothetical protein
MRRFVALTALCLLSLTLLGAISRPGYFRSLIIGGGPADADGGAVIEDNGNATFSGDVTVSGALSGDMSAQDLSVNSLDVGGGAGSTGATITSAGAADFDGAVRVGGGFGSTGSTIDAAGNGDFDGAVRVGGGFGSTGATLAADGSAQFDSSVVSAALIATTLISAPLLTVDSALTIDVLDDTADSLLTISNDDATYRANVLIEGALLTPGIHNNGGTGDAAHGAVASGTYTPTVAGTINVASSTPKESRWTRVGNVVTVFGAVDVTPTAGSTLTVLGLTLPVASDISTVNLSGLAVIPTSTPIALVVAPDDSNERANLGFISSGTGNHPINYSYIYEVE